MTPAARLHSAAEILDTIAAGTPAERALTNWARANRFAGAKDRAALRDHVHDVLRCWRSCAHLGGAATGRGRVLGLVRAQGHDPATLFTGARHAPAPLTDADAPCPGPMPRGVALDCPDWLLGPFDRSLGAQADATLAALRHRAPVFVRVNTARTTRAAAAAALAEDGIATTPHALAETALRVTAQPRRLRHARAYTDGLVELQDAASQAVVARLPALAGAQVLDYCAGGGGKALAMAARGAHVTAHDAAPGRMADLPARAARAQARIKTTAQPAGRFDLVLVDAPCSGSGAWRRDPEGKWRLTPQRLDGLHAAQADILQRAWAHVRPGGWLAYATCSLLASENTARIDAFTRTTPDAVPDMVTQLTPADGGDGFFCALLSRSR